MKLAILPDMHLGFGEGTELEDDAFDVFAEALEKSLDCDLILVTGDMFDSRNPSTEVFTRTMQTLITPILAPVRVRLVDLVHKEKRPLIIAGIPIVAIHGTHERRAPGLLNPVQALERAGFLIHLHCNGAIFKEGQNVCIQGLSGVPEQYAEAVLKEWDPRPVPGCINIFLIHQNLDKFMYAPVAVRMEHIPKGFDLYISGHIHEPQLTQYEGVPFLIAGSTITTQIKKESAKPHGFWKADLGEQITLEFIEFASQRAVYYLEAEEKTAIENTIRSLLDKPHKKKPIIRIKMKKDLPLDDIVAAVADQAIVSIKKDFAAEELPVTTLEEHSLSVQELGKKLLQQNLQQAALDPGIFETIFELLVENKPEAVIDLLAKG